MLPERTQVPVPFLVIEVAPVLSPMTAARVFAPVLVPMRVRVLAAVPPLKPIDPVFVKFNAPVPEASIVLLACNENNLLVLTASPVYLSVPLLRMRVLDVPIPLALPVLDSVLILIVP